jgi:outer membrane protein OmpA-like peptidoglycan-associated protein
VPPSAQEPRPRDPLGSGPTQPGAAPAAPPATVAPAPTPAAPAGQPPAATPAAPGQQGELERRRRDDRFAPGVSTQERSTVRIEDLRRERRERVEEGGSRVIIEEPGNRRIVRENDRVIIQHDETERFRRSYDNSDVRVERRGREEITIIRRPNGVEIVTVRDTEGNLLRRVRREGGREVILIENDYRDRPRGRVVFQEVVRLPPPVIRIPREKYIVEVESASQEDLVEAFTAPPVERIERRYTLDEIRQNQDVRERVRRVDLDTVTFDSGSWTLSPDQVGAMTGVAQAILAALRQNPNEVFLVEGHTDAVGPDIDNLTLSDRRAETVAIILTERFGVPAENLTTQGYGEQYLKINTEAPERDNRRATIRRITPLLQGAER